MNKNNTPIKIDLASCVTLAEYADGHCFDLYHRGRLIGGLIEDCKNTPGVTAPVAVGHRGQQLLYRPEDIDAVYPIVKARYKRASLPKPRSVQREDGEYCNIPALVEVLKVDYTTIGNFLNDNMAKVPNVKPEGSARMWHKDTAVALIEPMWAGFFKHDPALNRPGAVGSDKDEPAPAEALAPAAPNPVPPSQPGGVAPVELDCGLLVALLQDAEINLNGKPVGEESNADRHFRERDMLAVRRNLDALRAGGRLVLYPRAAATNAAVCQANR